MSSGEFQVGQMVYWTHHPLAKLMKIEDSGGLWKLGMLVEHNQENTYIVLSDGELYACEKDWIQTAPDIAG